MQLLFTCLASIQNAYLQLVHDNSSFRMPSLNFSLASKSNVRLGGLRCMISQKIFTSHHLINVALVSTLRLEVGLGYLVDVDGQNNNCVPWKIITPWSFWSLRLSFFCVIVMYSDLRVWFMNRIDLYNTYFSNVMSKSNFHLLQCPTKSKSKRVLLDLYLKRVWRNESFLEICG